jgi:hypothetical protein
MHVSWYKKSILVSIRGYGEKSSPFSHQPEEQPPAVLIPDNFAA